MREGPWDGAAGLLANLPPGAELAGIVADLNLAALGSTELALVIGARARQLK